VRNILFPLSNSLHFFALPFYFLATRHAKKISRIDRRFAAHARLKNKKSAGAKAQQRQEQN
jgi:hypothetical protein